MENQTDAPKIEVAQAKLVDNHPELFFVDTSGQFIGAYAGGAEPPVGAVQVPTPPPVAGATWNGTAWQNPPEPDAVLNPARFAYLLAYTGLGDVWDALETALKQTDRATYAALQAQRVKTQFHLNTTLQFVAQHRATALAAFPDADLSVTAIRAAWKLAAEAHV